MGIYAHYVENTSVSFENKVPSVNEFRRRIETTLVNYPFLVAEYNEEIVGYAYANVFHSKYEYNNSAEVSVYIKKEYHGMNVGKTLYSMLEEELYERGVLTVYARVASTTKEDEPIEIKISVPVITARLKTVIVLVMLIILTMQNMDSAITGAADVLPAVRQLAVLPQVPLLQNYWNS